MKEHLKKVLVSESVPVWLTLTFIMVGSLGTYFISPLITQRQEAQRIKTDFVIKNLDGISSRTRSLLAITSVIHQKMLHGKTISDDDFSTAYTCIAELQWDIISLSIIFVDDETRKLIFEFQQASTKMQASFQELQSSIPSGSAEVDAIIKRDTAIIGDAMLLALQVSMRIAELGGVKTEQPDIQPLPKSP